MPCKSFPLFTLFLYLLAFIHLSSSFNLSGYELIDLEESSNSLFKADAGEWKSIFPENNDNMIVSFCQGFPLLGGYLTYHNDGGAYLQREYNDLPQHETIHFSFILWIEGDWNIVLQDLFKLSFDFEPLQVLNMQRYAKSDALCKSIEDQNVFRVDGAVNHNESSLIFRVIAQPSTLEDQIMFGIRELNFTLISTSSSNADLDPQPDSQKSQIRNLLELPSTSHSKERMAQSITCDSTCNTCSGTTANDCITCPSDRFLRVLGSGVSFCAPSYYPQFKDFINYVVLTPPDKSGQPCLAVLANTMQYVRYLDMEMPESLTRLAIGQGRSILSIRYGMHMPNSLVEHFVWYPLEDVFTRQGLHSSFLVNYWQEITSFGIIIVAVLVFTICEQVCKMAKWRIATTVFETLRVMTRCNLLLVLLTTSFGDIILFGSFEFRTFYHSFDAGSTYASFFFFVFMLVIITCHFALLVIIERKAKQAITVGFQEQTFFGKIRQEFQVLYTSFHWTNVIGRLFMLVYMVRVGLPMLFSAYVYVSPLAQVIIDLLINIAILVIIGYFRPFKKKINMIQIVLFETMVFIMNVCMLIVTIISVYGSAEGHSFETCGNIVVIGNVLIQLFILIFLIIKVILEMRIILSLKHLSTEEKIIAWFQLLFLILQQGGMGFEMISEGPAAEFQDQFSQNLGAPTTLNNTTNMALQTSMQYKRGAIMPFPNINDSRPVGNGRNTNRSHDNSYINSIEMRDSIEPQFNSPTNYRNNFKNLSARSQRGTASKGFQSRRKDPGSPPRGIRKPGTRYGDGTLTVSMNITDSPILYEEGVGQPHRVSFTHREPSDSRIVYSEEPPVISYGDWATKRGSKNKLLDLYYSMRNTTGKLASNGRARKTEQDIQPRSTSIRGSAKVAPWLY